MRDVVLTWLLNATPDPQRGRSLAADVGLIRELRKSVARHGRALVVLTDCLDEPDDGLTTFVRVEPGGNPYWRRWHLTADWLTGAEDVARVWCVDGTDVEMLHDPFPHMRPGDLYVGSEPGMLNDRRSAGWFEKYCRSTTRWVRANAGRPILNVGLIGGDRRDVLEVARALAAAESDGDVYEMGAFNRTVYERWPGHATGSLVHSRFRANDRAAASWWRHK